MGHKLIDQYTLLHFAVGIVVYFWGISLPVWFVIHIIFEILENTPQGIAFINNTFTIWPGGKPQANKFINRVGDTIGAILGWVLAYYVDEYGKKWELY